MSAPKQPLHAALDRITYNGPDEPEAPDHDPAQHRRTVPPRPRGAQGISFSAVAHPGGDTACARVDAVAQDPRRDFARDVCLLPGLRVAIGSEATRSRADRGGSAPGEAGGARCGEIPGARPDPSSPRRDAGTDVS